MSTENEIRYYDALKRISSYMTVVQLRRSSQEEYGLDFEEALEYAYENIIGDARRSLFGKRRPKAKAPQTSTDGSAKSAGGNAVDAATSPGEVTK